MQTIWNDKSLDVCDGCQLISQRVGFSLSLRQAKEAVKDRDDVEMGSEI